MTSLTVCSCQFTSVSQKTTGYKLVHKQCWGYLYFVTIPMLRLTGVLLEDGSLHHNLKWTCPRLVYHALYKFLFFQCRVMPPTIPQSFYQMEQIFLPNVDCHVWSTWILKSLKIRKILLPPSQINSPENFLLHQAWFPSFSLIYMKFGVSENLPSRCLRNGYFLMRTDIWIPRSVIFARNLILWFHSLLVDVWLFLAVGWHF